MYEGRNIVIQNDQLYLLAKQNHRLKMLELSGQAKCAIVDSPLLLSNIYGRLHNSITNKFEDFTLELFDSFNNLNYFINRKENSFEKEGRFQKNIEEAKKIDKQIYDYLNNNNIKYEKINGIDDFPFNKIVEKLMEDNKNE